MFGWCVFSNTHGYNEFITPIVMFLFEALKSIVQSVSLDDVQDAVVIWVEKIKPVFLFHLILLN